ncbi:MAG: urea transporter, partial [Ignavibacteriaceae bacterium]|nr:urea transporter [Ignavibacteriaceae bacterium]
MRLFIDSILYSYAQIFFSNRRWFGAAALAATILLPSAALLALLGVIISNTIAALLKFDTEKIRSGFYGFNGILIGAAAAYYYQIDLFLLSLILIFIIISFFVTAVLENHLAVAFNLPGLSLPFVLSIYIFIIFLSNYDFINVVGSHQADSEYFSFLPNTVTYYFRSLALILFQPNILSGVIIAIALLIFSRVLFTLSIFAFALNYFFLGLILPDLKDSLIILSSFNS